MIGTILKSAAIGGAVTVCVALGLVASQRPDMSAATQGEGLDFSEILGRTMSAPEPRAVPMRDGYGLQTRAYGEAGPLVVMVHGSGWNGLQFNDLAQALSGRARVLVPDLRGHGAEPGRRGDVDHIGQLEEDFADLIAAEAQPAQKVILLGHSSGGGLVVRMAGGAYGDRMDGAILLAPFLSHKAPTTRANSGGWARPLLRRIIGLSILNTFRITALNHLPVITFSFPSQVLDGPLGHLATSHYSFRLNTSYAPRGDYQADIAALPRFLLIAGSADEAMDAAAYAPLLTPINDGGQVLTVDGVGHLAIVDAPETLAAITGFLDEF